MTAPGAPAAGGTGGVLLLPCPFCGEQPSVAYSGRFNPDKTTVSCENDDCDVTPSVDGFTPDSAKAKWNARAPSLAEAGAVRLREENDQLRALLAIPDDLRVAMEPASQGTAYTSGPPWFWRGDVVLVGSPDPHAGTIIADCDPVDMRHDYREAGREVLDAADDAIVLAAAWNRLLAQAAALSHRGAAPDPAVKP